MAYTGRMPITSAATSMSRIAIHARPMRAAHEVLRDQREHDDDAEQNRYFSRRRVDRASRRCRAAARDRARRRIVGEPLDAREQPVDEELRGQRRHREVEALDAQARDAEEHADDRRDTRRRAAATTSGLSCRHAHHEVVGRVGADRHEAAGAERDLAAVADQDVQADAPRATGSGTGSGSTRNR